MARTAAHSDSVNSLRSTWVGLDPSQTHLSFSSTMTPYHSALFRMFECGRTIPERGSKHVWAQDVQGFWGSMAPVTRRGAATELEVWAPEPVGSGSGWVDRLYTNFDEDHVSPTRT